jgi:hypothetical protein
MTEMNPETEKTLNDARLGEIKNGRAAGKLSEAVGDDFGAKVHTKPSPSSKEK